VLQKQASLTPQYTPLQNSMPRRLNCACAYTT